MFRPHKICKTTVTLESFEDKSSTVRHFTFTLSENTLFTPGQFITLLFATQTRTYRRQYSIASSPNKLPRIALSVKRIMDGVGSTFLWNLRPGDIVNAMFPMGVFVVRDEHKVKPLVFIGTGTGVAPFVSMVSALVDDHYAHPITVITGHRLDDIYAKDFQDLPIRYLPALSSQGFHVQDMIHKHIPESYDAHFYLCGLYDMIKDVAQLLISKGVNAKHIHFERYD